MAEDSETSKLHDKVAERAGGKINCPICGTETGWSGTTASSP
jgi:hypothetical protein